MELQQLEQSAEVDTAKSLAPQFVRVPGDKEVQEGKLLRLDCRVQGRPYPEVTWLLNGRQIHDDSTHKILVNESGNHSLMIHNCNMHDAGSIKCIARNKSGEAFFEVSSSHLLYFALQFRILLNFHILFKCKLI